MKTEQRMRKLDHSGRQEDLFQSTLIEGKEADMVLIRRLRPGRRSVDNATNGWSIIYQSLVHRSGPSLIKRMMVPE